MDGKKRAVWGWFPLTLLILAAAASWYYANQPAMPVEGTDAMAIEQPVDAAPADDASTPDPATTDAVAASEPATVTSQEEDIKDVTPIARRVPDTRFDNPRLCSGPFLVYFKPRSQASSDADAAEVPVEEQSKLNEVAFRIRTWACQAKLVGHTDDKGNETDNKKLGLSRAEAVRQYLEQKGVPGDQIKSVSSAGGAAEGQICDPAAEPTPGECERQNNNVVITLF